MTRFRWLVLVLLIALLVSLVPNPISAAQGDDPLPPPGSLIKSATDVAVYRVMDGRTMRHIADWATFLAWDFDAGAIQIVPDGALRAFTLGPALTMWVTGVDDTALYFLRRGERYPVPDQATLTLTGGTVTQVAQIPDDLLHSFPLAERPLEVPQSYTPPPPAVNHAMWIDDRVLAVWDESGVLMHWDGSVWETIDQPEDPVPLILPLEPMPFGPPITITAAAMDFEDNVLWSGTFGQGLFHHDLKADTWTAFTTFNSDLPDNTITDLALADDGTLWIASPSRLTRYRDGTFEVVREGVPSSALALGPDGVIWLAGENAIARVQGEYTTIYDAFDHPQLLDNFAAVTVDDQGRAWFVGSRYVHEWGTGVRTIDRVTGRDITPATGDPPNILVDSFPDPYAGYNEWLTAWPRPEGDNGRCMHYLQGPAGDVYEVREQIARLERLGVRWVLVNYTHPMQIAQMAPLFADADITVVWRPFVRPYQRYDHWAEDVVLLRALGLPPYIQVYNEPSLEAEWDGQPIDQALFLANLVEGVRAVYDAGGYPGLQTINADWTRVMLQELIDQGAADTFDRLWFAAHMYGGNHPPEYDADSYSVIGGMAAQARVFEDVLGFVPPFIAGEGGWRPGEAGDTRYPPVSEAMHRDYHVAVFEWFRTGTMSNGDPLPDYLFAWCPWLLSDPVDPAAWYDSASGNRTGTIQAVEALPPFERTFSWE